MHLGPYPYFPEEITYAASFRDIGSINYWHLIIIIRAICKETVILCFGAHVKGTNPIFKAGMFMVLYLHPPYKEHQTQTKSGHATCQMGATTNDPEKVNNPMT
jgi:hypothetical protein